MKNLSEIKTEAQNLFFAKGMESAIEFLRTISEAEKPELLKDIYLIEARLNSLKLDNKEKLITTEEFIVEKNRLEKAVGKFIEGIDDPKVIKGSEFNVTKKVLLKTILLIQFFILIGIGFLIYQYFKSI